MSVLTSLRTAADRAEHAAQQDTVGAGSDDQLPVEKSVGSGEPCVAACAEHRRAGPGGQTQDEFVLREPVPAGEAHAVAGCGFGDRESRQRRARTEQISCGSSWFGAQQVREGYDGCVPEMAEPCGESAPYGTGRGGYEHLEFVDEREIIIPIIWIAKWHDIFHGLTLSVLDLPRSRPRRMHDLHRRRSRRPDLTNDWRVAVNRHRVPDRPLWTFSSPPRRLSRRAFFGRSSGLVWVGVVHARQSRRRVRPTG